MSSEPVSPATTTSSAAPAGRAKNLLLFGAKIVVASVLLGWLVRSDSLKFSALRVMIDKPWLIALDLALFATTTTIAAIRWRALLAIAGVSVPLTRALPLQLTAVFFNVVVPGNVGGDVVKALYVARDAKAEKRTTILLIVFVERLLGLTGLVGVAAVVTLLRAPTLFGDALLRPAAVAILLLAAAIVVGTTGLLVVVRVAGAKLESWTSGTSALSKLLARLVAAMRLLASGPKKLLVAFGLSMVLHACSIAFFTLLTRVISGQDVAYSAVATVFPLGILTMILPISPAGLGVGHVAFDRLFAAIGLTGGATIFNVFLLGQIVPCLSGVVPYLALRRKGALTET